MAHFKVVGRHPCIQLASLQILMGELVAIKIIPSTIMMAFSPVLQLVTNILHGDVGVEVAPTCRCCPSSHS